MSAPYSRPGTSYDAAKEIEPHALSIRERVYEMIRDRGSIGATDDEISTVMEIGLNTVRPRRNELEAARRIKDSSRRRSTPSGRGAIVWVVASIPDAPMAPPDHPAPVLPEVGRPVCVHCGMVLSTIQKREYNNGREPECGGPVPGLHVGITKNGITCVGYGGATTSTWRDARDARKAASKGRRR